MTQKDTKLSIAIVCGLTVALAAAYEQGRRDGQNLADSDTVEPSLTVTDSQKSEAKADPCECGEDSPATVDDPSSDVED